MKVVPKAAAQADPFASTPGEARHYHRVAVSQRRMALCGVLSATACAGLLSCLAVMVDRVLHSPLRAPISPNFLGWQLLFATEPQSILHSPSDSGVLLIPVAILVVFSVGMLLWRWYRIASRIRDIGFGLPSCRTRTHAALRLLRAAAVVTVAVFHYLVIKELRVTPVVDAVYRSACALTPVYSSLSLWGIQGLTASSTCAGKLSAALGLDESQHNYLVKDPSAALNVSLQGAKIYVHAPPVGIPYGCPRGLPLPTLSTLVPFPVAPGVPVSEWLPDEDLGRRRCEAPASSPRDYVMSNFATLAGVCDPGAYAYHVNITSIAWWGHVPQWYCLEPYATTGSEVRVSSGGMTVRYGTAGWLQVMQGTGCAASTDPAWLQEAWAAAGSASTVATSAGFNATIRSSGGALVITVPRARVSAADLDILTLRHPSSHLYDDCAELSIGCVLRNGDLQQWFRAVSSNGCTRSFSAGITREEYEGSLISHTASFVTASETVLYAGLAEVALDVAEAIMFTALY